MSERCAKDMLQLLGYSSKQNFLTFSCELVSDYSLKGYKLTFEMLLWNAIKYIN